MVVSQKLILRSKAKESRKSRGTVLRGRRTSGLGWYQQGAVIADLMGRGTGKYQTGMTSRGVGGRFPEAKKVLKQ